MCLILSLLVCCDSKETTVTPFVANPVVTVTAQQVVAYAATVSNDEVGAMLEKLVTDVEVVINAMGPSAPHALHSLLDSIILTRRSRDINVAMTLLKKVVA